MSIDYLLLNGEADFNRFLSVSNGRPSVPVIHVWNPIPPPVNAARAPTCTPPAVDAMAVTLSTLRFANVPVALDPILLTATVLCAVDCDGVPIDFGIGQ